MDGESSELGELVEAIYDAAIDAEWSHVMALLRRRYRSTAENLYLLDFDRAAVSALHCEGLSDRFLAEFDACYFTPDNPWPKALPLRRPGVVRTDRRLAAYFRDREVLRRSQYYNEWMRPQRLAHTLGATLLAEPRKVVNFTLLRPQDAGPYAAAEVADFEGLTGHLRRALRVGRRLEQAAAQGKASVQAIDRLPIGVAMLGADDALLHANPPFEALLERREGLRTQDGRLRAADPRDQRSLEAHLRRAAAAVDGAAAGPDGIPLRRARGAPPLLVSAIRLSPGRGGFAVEAPALLVLAVDPEALRPADLDAMRRRYGLTPAEGRLAQALIGGRSLKEAAEADGVAYETARWRLKALFQKTGASRQAELVSLLLRDVAIAR